MDDQNLKDKQRELADDQMIEQAFLIYTWHRVTERR